MVKKWTNREHANWVIKVANWATGWRDPTPVLRNFLIALCRAAPRMHAESGPTSPRSKMQIENAPDNGGNAINFNSSPGTRGSRMQIGRWLLFKIFCGHCSAGPTASPFPKFRKQLRGHAPTPPRSRALNASRNIIFSRNLCICSMHALSHSQCLARVFVRVIFFFYFWTDTPSIWMTRRRTVFD